jgi:prevent-host-death family protein
MKKVNLSEVQEHLAHYLREADEEEVVIMRHGKPVGVLIGFTSEEDWLDYLLENHPQFAERIARARRDLRAGLGIPLEEVVMQLESSNDA